ncbi:MAG: polysaccharide pyruvyl transferase family protein [Fibrobacter sp.]|jgi:hypothetical protein|nr:polysaccharide pyruvyl transferase family protein [Fibrobacter sp.]
MKIAVLTLPLETNYGGILQAYAMQQVLKGMGHDVVTIQEPLYYFPWWKRPLAYAKRFLQKYVLKKTGIKAIFHENRRKKFLFQISHEMRPFIESRIQKCDLIEVKRRKDQYSAIVVGSDQVWRPKFYTLGYKKMENAFLAFAKDWNIKRVAYAASFGTDEWEYDPAQTFTCKELVKKFDAVSVREKSGVNLCQKYLDVKAKWVLDPTMLLNVSHYVSLFEKEKIEPSKGNLFVYVLDKCEDTEQIEKKIIGTFSLRPFYTSTDDARALLEARIATKPETWLRSFYDAEFILTDSFHACVFSILFNKPFVIYGNQERGMTRFNSLLSLFNLQNRLISSKTTNLEGVLHTPIDWNAVNEILEKQRVDSKRFLLNALEGK